MGEGQAKWIGVDRRTGAIVWQRRAAVADLARAIPEIAAEYAEMRAAFQLGRPSPQCGEDVVRGGLIAAEELDDEANWAALEAAEAAFAEAARAAYDALPAEARAPTKTQ